MDSAGENTIIVAPGANAGVTVESSQARAAISDSDVLLVQLEIPVTTAVDAARLARDAGSVVIVNASPSGAAPHDLLTLAQLADPGPFEPALALMYGRETLEQAFALFNQDERFFGLTKLGNDFEGSAIHQRLLDAYRKVRG